MERALVDYSDIDAHCDISDEMYASNLAHQFRYSDDKELDWIVSFAHVDDSTRLAFARATRVLPEDIQRILFESAFRK